MVVFDIRLKILNVIIICVYWSCSNGMNTILRC